MILDVTNRDMKPYGQQASSAGGVEQRGRQASLFARLACLFVLAALSVLLAGCGQQAQPSAGQGSQEATQQEDAGLLTDTEPKVDGSLAIIHTNDVHGYVNAGDGVLGLAAVAQVKADYEARGYDVMLLDAGDMLQGNLYANNDKGASVIEFMNEAGYGAAALGNHDFDYGADVLEERMAAAKFPMLAANITVDATGELFAEDHIVMQAADGTKVGVFGLDTPSTKTSSSPKNTLGLTFAQDDDLYACAQAQIDELRDQGCSVVVCLGHLGEDASNKGDTARDVVEHTKGLDLFIDGHDHEVENQLVADADGNDVLVVETGYYLANIGVLTCDDGTWEETLIAAGEYEGSDPAVAASVAAYADEIDQQLSEVIGRTLVALNGEEEPGNRDRETNFGDFITDAVLWQAEHAATKAPDAAIINGGNIRAGIEAGDITLRDVQNALPFDNQLVTITATGAQLLEALEAATQTLPKSSGAFPQVSGITFTVNTTVPYAAGEKYPGTTVASPAEPGSRVTITDVGGRGFDSEETYVIATSTFIALGGDAYHALAEAAQDSLEYLGYVDYQAIQNYLEDELDGTIPEAYAEPQGRVVVVS